MENMLNLKAVNMLITEHNTIVKKQSVLDPAFPSCFAKLLLENVLSIKSFST